jgi:hypothetical protein
MIVWSLMRRPQENRSTRLGSRVVFPTGSGDIRFHRTDTESSEAGRPTSAGRQVTEAMMKSKKKYLCIGPLMRRPFLFSQLRPGLEPGISSLLVKRFTAKPPERIDEYSSHFSSLEL